MKEFKADPEKYYKKLDERFRVLQDKKKEEVDLALK